MRDNDVAQPIKPYLRYRDLANRIIAMPAFVGGDIAIAGIKWIASFPANIQKGIPRAHSVTILNAADTGAPLCVVNTSLISGIRTAAVTGVVLREYLENINHVAPLKVGITGFGPIGQLHLDMLSHIAADRVEEVRIYDIRSVDISKVPSVLSPVLKFVNHGKKRMKM